MNCRFLGSGTFEGTLLGDEYGILDYLSQVALKAGEYDEVV